MTVAKTAEKIEMEFKVRPYRRKIRCIENGREWESIAALCREYGLPEMSVRVSIKKYGKYSNYHFEYVD